MSDGFGYTYRITLGMIDGEPYYSDYCHIGNIIRKTDSHDISYMMDASLPVVAWV